MKNALTKEISENRLYFGSGWYGIAGVFGYGLSAEGEGDGVKVVGVVSLMAWNAQFLRLTWQFQ